MERSIKLFVSLGTQKFQFNRLVNALNNLVKNGIYEPKEIVIQSAVYEVTPLFIHYKLLEHSEFENLIDEADVIITHSGVNSIMSCMKKGKPLVIVPRLKEFGEHVDNHQVEIAELMRQRFGMVVNTNINELLLDIRNAVNHKYHQWESQREMLLACLRTDINCM